MASLAYYSVASTLVRSNYGIAIGFCWMHLLYARATYCEASLPRIVASAGMKEDN